MKLYRTIIAPRLTPNNINYCKEKKNQGCGVYIPKEVLDILNLKIGDCVKVYVPKYLRKCIVFVSENALSKPNKLEYVPNPSPRCSSKQPNYKIRRLDPQAREIWLLEDGGVVRIPKHIAKKFELTTILDDCKCKYVSAELYIVKDKKWIIVENFKFL